MKLVWLKTWPDMFVCVCDTQRERERSDPGINTRDSELIEPIRSRWEMCQACSIPRTSWQPVGMQLSARAHERAWAVWYLCCGLYYWLSRTIRGESSAAAAAEEARAAAAASEARAGSWRGWMRMRLSCRLSWSEPELRCSDSLQEDTDTYTERGRGGEGE